MTHDSEVLTGPVNPAAEQMRAELESERALKPNRL